MNVHKTSDTDTTLQQESLAAIYMHLQGRARCHLKKFSRD